jgi:hypothetical protein
MSTRAAALARLFGTRTRTARLWNRIQARWRREDGYQPFGYDFPTIRITKPGWVPVLEDIASAHNSLPSISP